MAYKFKPYRSVYRDPQSVKINEILRKRYVDAFAADTLTQNALSEMLVSADFAGDVEKAAQLRSTIDARSNKYAESGRYETLGVNIARDAAEFTQGYTPLKKNYEAREAAKKTAQQTLNPDDYQKWLGWSLTRRDAEGNYQPYTGIEYDENGYVIPDTYYQADPVPAKVDIEGQIIKEVNALPVMKQGGYTAASFSFETYTDENGNTMKVPVIRTTQGQVITGKDSQAIFQAVKSALNNPEVQSYLNFKSEINTFDQDGGSLQQTIEGRVQELQLELGRATGSQRDNIQSQIEDLKRAQKSGMTGQMRDAVANIYKQRIMDRYQTDAERFAGQSVYGGGSQFQINPIWLKSLEARAASGDVVNRPILAGDTQEVLATIAQQEGVDPADVVVTAESLRAGEQKLHEEAAGELSAALQAYPELESVLEANNVDPSNFEEIEGYMEDLTVEEVRDLASDLSAGGTRDPQQVLQDLFDLQAGMIAHADRSEQVDALIDYANGNEEVMNTPVAINNAAIAASGDIAKQALDNVIMPDGARVKDVAPEQLNRSAATALAHQVIKELFVDERGDWISKPATMSPSEQNIFDMLTPILTSTDEKGLALPEPEAREAFNTALAYAAAQYDAAMGSKYTRRNTNMKPQGMEIPTLPAGNFDYDSYIANLDAETTRRQEAANEALNQAVRVTFNWPAYPDALGDADGVESKQLRDAVKGRDLSSFAAAQDLKDKTGQSVGAESASWRTATITDSKGKTTEEFADNPLDSWKIDDLMFSAYGVNGKVIPTIRLSVSAGTGNNKVERTIQMDANQAVRNFINTEPGIGSTGSFGDAILGYTPAHQFQTVILNALATSGATNEVTINLPGNAKTGRIQVSVPLEKDEKGNLTGNYPVIEMNMAKQGNSGKVVIEDSWAKGQGFEDVLEAAALTYMRLVEN
tara:strand:- start:7908 stop:10685 length:2778 start_codon:yes stop_codon:yes gene_type:complete